MHPVPYDPIDPEPDGPPDTSGGRVMAWTAAGAMFALAAFTSGNQLLVTLGFAAVVGYPAYFVFDALNHPVRGLLSEAKDRRAR